jgi:hypothetical protein
MRPWQDHGFLPPQPLLLEYHRGQVAQRRVDSLPIVHVVQEPTELATRARLRAIAAIRGALPIVLLIFPFLIIIFVILILILILIFLSLETWPMYSSPSTPARKSALSKCFTEGSPSLPPSSTPPARIAVASAGSSVRL